MADGRPAVLAAAVLRLADPPALGEYPPAVNLRPDGDHSAGRWRWPTARVAAILDRIATDIDELARARRADDLTAAALLPDRGPSGHVRVTLASRLKPDHG